MYDRQGGEDFFGEANDARATKCPRILQIQLGSHDDLVRALGLVAARHSVESEKEVVECVGPVFPFEVGTLEESVDAFANHLHRPLGKGILDR